MRVPVTIGGKPTGPKTPVPTTPSVKTTSKPPTAAVPTPSADVTPPRDVRTDSFDRARPPMARSLVARAQTHSGVEHMVELLNDARHEILVEHARVASDVAVLMHALRDAHFADAAWATHAQSWVSLQERFRILRERLLHVRRRLTALKRQHAKTVDAGQAQVLKRALDALGAVSSMAQTTQALLLLEESFQQLGRGAPRQSDDDGPPPGERMSALLATLLAANEEGENL
jgi:hypothetical protein